VGYWLRMNSWVTGNCYACPSPASTACEKCKHVMCGQHVKVLGRQNVCQDCFNLAVSWYNQEQLVKMAARPFQLATYPPAGSSIDPNSITVTRHATLRDAVRCLAISIANKDIHPTTWGIKDLTSDTVVSQGRIFAVMCTLVHCNS
jgi:hypothetical protein